MTNYRELLRLRSLGFNHSQIAASAEVSRPTIIAILQKAQEQELTWQSASDLSDRELANLLFPQSEGKPTYKMPDYSYVHRETAK